MPTSSPSFLDFDDEDDDVELDFDRRIQGPERSSSCEGFLSVRVRLRVVLEERMDEGRERIASPGAFSVSRVWTAEMLAVVVGFELST